MSQGYFLTPRSLTRDPLWIKLSAKQKVLFNTILDHACFKPQKFDDFGVVIDLEIGQFCTTVRALIELCGDDFSKNDIERNLLKLKVCGFLRQEVRHKKTVITITHKDTYDLMVKSFETANETNLRQTRDKLETQKKNDKNAKNEKKKNNIVPTEASELSLFLFHSIKQTKPDVKEPNLESWALEINRMVKVDNREWDKIREIIHWLPGSSFWSINILSAGSLRKNFDKLELAKNQKQNQKPREAEINKPFSIDPDLEEALKRRSK